MKPKEGKLVNFGGTLGMIIPKEIVVGLGLKPGDKVLKTFDPLNHTLILKFPGHEEGFLKKMNSITPEIVKDIVRGWLDENHKV